MVGWDLRYGLLFNQSGVIRFYTNALNDLDYRKVGTDRRAVRSGVARGGAEAISLMACPACPAKVPPSGTTEGGHVLSQNKLR